MGKMALESFLPENITQLMRIDPSFDGKSGNDVVQFRGPSGEYTIEQKNGTILVNDLIQGRDGVNILINIELLRFTDKDI